MKKFALPFILFVTLAAATGCEDIAETILVGGADVPYDKIGMNMFPRDPLADDVDTQMLEVKSLGINFIRVNFWFDLAYMPTSGAVPDFSTFDEVALAARNAGLDIVVILAFVPEWLQNDPNWKTVYINDYVIPVATRYRGMVRHWEIWNEPDLSSHGMLDGSPEDYFDLLRRASTAIRSVDPDAKVVSAATANIVLGGIAKFEWMDTLIGLGLAQYADILNVHYYSELDPELSFFGGPMVEGAGMPVWVTETGKIGQANHLSYFENVTPYIDKSLNPERIFWYSFTPGPGAPPEDINPDGAFAIVTYWGGQRFESPLYTHLANR